jgi:hypothetical protein
VVRPANSITERLRAVLLTENFPIMESKVLGKIGRCDDLSNCGNKLFLEHIFDVIHTLRVGLAHMHDVDECNEELSGDLSDEFVVGGKYFCYFFSFFFEAACLFTEERSEENRRDLVGRRRDNCSR